MTERTRRRPEGTPQEPASPRRRRGTAAPAAPQERRRVRGGGAPDAGKAATPDDVALPETPTNVLNEGPPAEPEAHSPSERSTSSVATDVTLPQLGESVTEGTITAWLVNVGDHVEADQMLFELSSDKIDTEVPSPAAGVLTEILVQVDETVEVGTVVARIGGEGDAPAPAAAAPEAAPEEPEAAPEAPAQSASESAPAPAAASASAQPPLTSPPLTSPLARREAADAGVDVSQVQGSGQGGRVTRQDVQAAASGNGAQGAQKKSPQKSPQAAPKRPPLAAGERERLEDVSRIRQRIAAKMIESQQSTASLTTVQEADATRIMQLRGRLKDTFAEREGVSLSPFAFLARASVIAIKRHELANAQADWDAGKVRIPEYVNLGIAVDTDKGLLVPNIKNADDLTLPALARAINDAARKARGEGDAKLEMQDIEGGTFTVTNTGSRGVLLDTPILNYPEVAILATGAIQKRPVVMDTDAGQSIAIRDMVYLCLTYDHRLLDGADAARFVTDVKTVIETHDWESEIGY